MANVFGEDNIALCCNKPFQAIQDLKKQRSVLRTHTRLWTIDSAELLYSAELFRSAELLHSAELFRSAEL